MKILPGFAAALFCLLLTMGEAGAQDPNKSGSASNQTGNSRLGAGHKTFASTARNSIKVLTKGFSRTCLRLFGKTYKLNKLEWMGSSKVLGGKKDRFNYAQIRLGNFRFYSEDGYREIGRNFNYKHVLVDLQKTVPVGVWWLNLQARAGVDYDLEISVGTDSKKGRHGKLGFRVKAAGAYFADTTAAADFGLVRIGIRAECHLLKSGIQGTVMMPLSDKDKLQRELYLFHVPVSFTLKAVLDRAKVSWSWKGPKRKWSEWFAIVLARWVPIDTPLPIKSFLTY